MIGLRGHGKAYLTRNLEMTLVGVDNVLEVECCALRDDAVLFDGRLTAFLRERRGSPT